MLILPISDSTGESAGGAGKLIGGVDPKANLVRWLILVLWASVTDFRH